MEITDPSECYEAANCTPGLPLHADAAARNEEAWWEVHGCDEIAGYISCDYAPCQPYQDGCYR